MTHKNERIYRAASIRENADCPRIGLTLRLDTDGMYRWYQLDGADTEVSGASIESAIEAARASWHRWDLILPEVA